MTGGPNPTPVAGTPCDLTPVLRLLVQTLKLPVLATYKSALDSFSKVLALAIQLSPVSYELLLEVCSLCFRAFAKERDRFMMSRTVVFELQQAIRFKTVLSDKTLMTLVQFLLQDCGGSLVPGIMSKHLQANASPETESFSTAASECMKQYFNDCIDFVADIHALRRMKVTIDAEARRIGAELLLFFACYVFFPLFVPRVLSSSCSFWWRGCFCCLLWNQMKSNKIRPLLLP